MNETRVTFNAVGNETKAGVTPFDTVAREIELLQDHVTVIAKENATLALKLAALEKDLGEVGNLRFRLLKAETEIQHIQQQTPQAPSELLLERLTEAVELIGECVRRDTFGAPYLAIHPDYDHSDRMVRALELIAVRLGLPQ